MEKFNDLKKLGWSEDLLTAIEAVTKKVNYPISEQPFIDIKDPFIPSGYFDSTSITIHSFQVNDSIIPILSQNKK